MAKKKTLTITARKSLAWTLFVLGTVVAGVMVGLVVAEVNESFNPGFWALAGVGALLGLLGAYRVFCPERLLLTPKHVLLKNYWGKVRGQIPYDNIADVRIHHVGTENPIETVGIDLIKSTAKDTWWPGPPFRLLKIYDVHIGDDWDKPAAVLVRLIKSKMDDFFRDVAQGEA
jgi:hypothetical protein